MSVPETGCQCKRFPVGCAARMTQEDLLCDVCRQGCAGAIGAPGARAMHLRQAPEITFKPLRDDRA